jgi:hypothetical protein
MSVAYLGFVALLAGLASDGEEGVGVRLQAVNNAIDAATAMKPKLYFIGSLQSR